MELAPGQIKEQQLKEEGGFSPQEISDWRAQTTDDMIKVGGFTSEKVDEYFGVKKFDEAPIENFFKQNLKKLYETHPDVYGPEPVKEAHTLLEAFEAGTQQSIAGLLGRKRTPDLVLPEHEHSMLRIAELLGTAAGDMVTGIPQLGAVFGGRIGALATGHPLGAAAGAGAGVFGLPTAMREMLMDAYSKGEVVDFGDFWERASSIFLKTLKSTATGAATLGTGSLAGKIVNAMGLPQIIKKGTVTAAEVAAMAIIGKGLEGEIPEPWDFIEGATVIGALHTGMKITKSAMNGISGKLRDVYKKTNNTPAEVAAMAEVDPSIQEDLLSDNITIPRAFDLPQAKMETPPETKAIEAPQQLTEPLPGFSEEYSPKTELFIKEPPLKKDQGKGSPLTKAQESVRERLASSGEKIDDRTWGEKWEDLKTEALDELNPWREFVEALTPKPQRDQFYKIIPEIDTLHDPYQLLTLGIGGNFGRYKQMIEKGMYNFKTLKNVGPSLQKVFEPVKGDLLGWRLYAMSKRAIELSERVIKVDPVTGEKTIGIETGIPLEEARQVVQEGAKKYEKVSQDFQEFKDHLLQFAVDSEILSEKSATKMKKLNQAHVAFYRLHEEGAYFGKDLNTREPFKPIAGSKLKILDPLQSAIRDIQFIVSMSERNRAMLAAKELAATHPDGEKFMKKVPQKARPIEVQSQEIQNYLAENGIDGDELKGFNIWRTLRKDLKANQAVVFEKGKAEVYEFSDESMIKTLRVLDDKTQNWVLKMLSIPAKSLRLGVTLSVDFQARNFLRDPIDGLVKSKHLHIPVVASIEGLASCFKDKESYQAFLKGGGAGGAIRSLKKSYLDVDIEELNKKTGFMQGARNIIATPLHLLSVVSELSELGTRLGDFNIGYKKDQSPEATFRNAYGSRDLIANYRRMGRNANIKAASMIIGFWNARLQGLDKSVRTFQEDPLGSTFKSMASITAVSTLLYFANKDDERWNNGDVNQSQKDLYWILFTEKDTYRIPKPYELGFAFGTIQERILEAFWKDNPKAFKDLSNSFIEAIAPGYMPTIAVPFLEHAMNQSRLTKHPIIPSNLEKDLPELQYTDYTTETAKKLGQALRAMTYRENQWSSPAVIENYVRAWSGTLGMQALQLTDAALIEAGFYANPNKPAPHTSDQFFFRAFMIKNPSRQNENIQDFYKAMNGLNQYKNTTKEYARRGDAQSAFEVFENWPSYINMETTHSAMIAQNAVIDQITLNPDITPVEKTQMVDDLIRGLIETATLGMEQYDLFEKEMKRLRVK